MKLYTHLNFGGNCEEAFRFYEKQIGGKITMMMKKSDLPPGAPAPPGPDNFVIHVRMNVAGVELIGNDVPPDSFKPIRSSYLYLAVDSPEAGQDLCGPRGWRRRRHEDPGNLLRNAIRTAARQIRNTVDDHT